jgi:hypothetical protein
VNAKDSRDIITKVWLFSELVNNKPAKGSNDYPIAIKAVHLDDNWKRTTLKQPKDVDPADALYEVAYEDDGTYITRILPKGTLDGDLLYWHKDTEKWLVLPAVVDDTLHILGIKDGVLQWVETQDCPE